MIPVTQTRTGPVDGNCFAASLASILNLPLRKVPDFPECNEDPGVDRFLAGYGLKYVEVPYDRADPPIGAHTIIGVSPRGGMHCVVGKDGRCVWDPHPMDGTGRGLTKPTGYGLLLPVGAEDSVTLHPDKDGDYALRYTAKDMSGKELKGALAPVYTHHDAIKDNRARTYATHSAEVFHLIDETKALLAASRISDKPVWAARLREAEADMAAAKNAALNGDLIAATRRQEHALAVTHHVLDALKGLAGRTAARDALPVSRLLKYDLADMLDAVGVDDKEFQRRSPEQRRRLLETAYQELERKTAKDATIQNATAAQLRARLEKIKGAQPETAALERLLKMKSAKDAFEGGPGTTNSASNTWYDVRPNEREAVLVGNGISASQARNWSGEGWMKLPRHVQAAWVAARVSKAKDASPRRARLHKALDKVLDSIRKD